MATDPTVEYFQIFKQISTSLVLGSKAFSEGMTFLERRKERVGHRVIVAVSGAAHALRDVLCNLSLGRVAVNMLSSFDGVLSLSMLMSLARGDPPRRSDLAQLVNSRTAPLHPPFIFRNLKSGESHPLSFGRCPVVSFSPSSFYASLGVVSSNVLESHRKCCSAGITVCCGGLLFQLHGYFLGVRSELLCCLSL